MRYLNRLVGAAVVLAFASASGFAQQGGGGQGGGGQGGGGQGGGGQGGGGQGGMGGQGTGQPSQSSFNLTQLEQAPTISAPGTSTTGGRAGTGGADASNFLGATMANPLFQGLIANAKSGAAPGGFGTPLYGTTTGGGAARGGAAGARGLAGGRGGIGGLGASQQSGTIIAPPIQISYQAVARFPTIPVAATQLQADLEGMISRSIELFTNGNGNGMAVSVEGSTVTLRGAVKDEEEAKTLIGMVRLTPGVRAVKNELTYPRP